MRSRLFVFLAFGLVLVGSSFLGSDGQQPVPAPNPGLDVIGLHGRRIGSYFEETGGREFKRFLSVEPGRKFILTDILTVGVKRLTLATDYKNKSIKAQIGMEAGQVRLESGIAFEQGDSVYVMTDTDGEVTLCGFFTDV